MSTYFLKASYALALLLLLLLHIAGCNGDVMCVEKERQALLNFKQGFVGEISETFFATWRDDHNNRDCCKWKGVECNNGTGQVQKLHLRGSETYSFSGKFNITLLLQLQILEYLDFSNNYYFANNIPEQMGSLSNLRYLNLSYNNFNGMIPYQLGNLLRLEYLSLEENHLVGAIPSQLRNLSRLEYLNLKANLLVGALPFHVGDLPLLHTLKLNFNYGLKMNDGKWLSNLTSLTNLDLSGLSHQWLQIISKLLPKLIELRLSECQLFDNDIYSLFDSNSNFSTSLSILDLSGNMLTSSTLHLLSNFSINIHELYLSETNITSFPLNLNFPSLMILDLSMNNLASSIFQGISNFGSKLEILNLKRCNLSDNNFRVPSSSIMNSLSSLGILDLSYNQLTLTIFNWIFNFTTNLHSLILDGNLLDGPIPNGFGTKMSSIEVLSLSKNKLQGEVPVSLGNLCTLRELDLSSNNLSGELSSFIESSSKCNKHNLEYLDLSDNQLTGELPKGIGLMYELKFFYIEGNSLEGDITELHLNNLSNLKTLDLSDNSLSLKFGTTWVPPFQIYELGLASCKMGPTFPRWLQTQSYLEFIDISDAGINDTVPLWFWNKLQYTYITVINMSHNNLIGTIPNLPPNLESGIASVVLNSNKFEGSLPPFLLQAASTLDLSKNKISDLISFLCSRITTTYMQTLDLSDNQIKGPLPDCWGHLTSLRLLDLSNNKLSGKIPPSLTTLIDLETLVLRNNSFIGELPSTLKNCSDLVILDMSYNLLSGLIPSWIGDSLRHLKVLSLKLNHFSGILPSHICYLRQIHVLDVSGNNLSGSIPTCVTEIIDKSVYLNRIVTKRLLSTKIMYFDIYQSNLLLTWKGQEYLFKNPELLLKSIDLSSNHLSGEIPTEFGKLLGLVSLNLSRNNLSGEIPYDIGNLNLLEFLDLSRNYLSGRIPSSLSQIDRLSVLDLSHNSLSGKIPLGTQLQSFDPWRFEANLDLCGKPLEKSCPGDETPIKPQGPATNDNDEKLVFYGAFYMSIGIGVFTGFWGLIGSILLWKPWRNAYLKFLDKLTVKIVRCLW